MSFVLGVDFGTLNVRVSVFDHQAGRLSSGTAPYPLKRKKEDPDFATQAHADHLRALCDATSVALAAGGIDGRSIAAIAMDTTGSSVVMVDEQLQPLDDYYLCVTIDPGVKQRRSPRRHTATALKPSTGVAACTPQSGASQKSCIGCGNNPGKRSQFATALEHCDMIAAELCGIKRLDELPTQRLRHGPQVDVERSSRRTSA